MRNFIKVIVLTATISACSLVYGEECALGAHFGPVSFDDERPVAALRKILAGTGISLVETGEFDAGTISARNVAGTVGEAVRRLAEGTNLNYTCNNGVMRVSQKPHPAIAPATTEPKVHALAAKIPPTNPQPAAPVKSVISINTGDSIRAKLAQFAKENQYQVSWTGDDLFAKQDVRFVGENFEDVINKFFIATKITGYITRDEGKMLNVFVQ